MRRNSVIKCARLAIDCRRLRLTDRGQLNTPTTRVEQKLNFYTFRRTGVCGCTTPQDTTSFGRPSSTKRDKDSTVIILFAEVYLPERNLISVYRARHASFLST